LQRLAAGDLAAVGSADTYYYFLILSGSAFFGCQWAFAFHCKSTDLLPPNEVLAGRNNGFLALIDFIAERRRNDLIRLVKGAPTTGFFKGDHVRARIDAQDGTFAWYIYDRNTSEIVAKVDALTGEQRNFPIWSGLKCSDSFKLIDSAYTNSHLHTVVGSGQFPISQSI